LSEKAPEWVLFCGLRQTFVTLQIDFTLVCLVFRLPIISIRKINRGVNWIKLNRFTGLALKGKSRHNGRWKSEAEIPNFPQS